MAGMADRGAMACVMECSSIGLEQGRVDLVDFDVAIFTNLGRDHLDYHEDSAIQPACVWHSYNMCSCVVPWKTQWHLKLSSCNCDTATHPSQIIPCINSLSHLLFVKYTVERGLVYLSVWFRYYIAGFFCVVPCFCLFG